MTESNYRYKRFEGFPVDVGRLIVEEAACTDYKSAQNLAIVSKLTREWSKFAWHSIVEVETANHGSLARLRARLTKTQDGHYIKHLRATLNNSPPGTQADALRLSKVVTFCPNLISLGIDWTGEDSPTQLPAFPDTLKILACRVESLRNLRACLHFSLTHLVLLSTSLDLWAEFSQAWPHLSDRVPLLEMLVFEVKVEAPQYYSTLLAYLSSVLVDTPEDCLCVFRMAAWDLSAASAGILEMLMSWAGDFFVLDLAVHSDDPKAARITGELEREDADLAGFDLGALPELDVHLIADAMDEVGLGRDEEEDSDTSESKDEESSSSDGSEEEDSDISESEDEEISSSDASEEEDEESSSSDGSEEEDERSDPVLSPDPVPSASSPETSFHNAICEIITSESIHRWHALYLAFPSCIYVPGRDESLTGGLAFIGGAHDAQEGVRPSYERLAQWKKAQEEKMSELASGGEDESEDD